MKKVLIFIGLSLLVYNTYAQFTLKAEFRPRTEYSHGYGNPADSVQTGSLFTSQRTRLSAGYKSDKLVTSLVLQDVRIWGNQPQLVMNEEQAVSVHEAWAEVFFTPKFSLKAGRMELNYDDQRMLGSVGWVQQARSHDIALFKYEGVISAHLGWAHNEGGNTKNNYMNPDTGATPKPILTRYRDMQLLWLNKKAGDLSVSLLFMNQGNEGRDTTFDTNKVPTHIKSATVYNQTIGTYISYKVGELKIAAGGYYQMGKILEGKVIKTKKQSAYQASIDLQYGFGAAYAGAGFELLSGNSEIDQPADENNAFNPYYGTNHKFNGWMDYYYVKGAHIASVGLQDIYLKGGYKKDKISADAYVHLFSAANDIWDRTTPANAKKAFSSKNLGQEIDLMCGYALAPNVNISLGYSHYMVTDALRMLRTANKATGTSNWAWVMLTVNPTLFEQKPAQ